MTNAPDLENMTPFRMGVESWNEPSTACPNELSEEESLEPCNRKDGWAGIKVSRIVGKVPKRASSQGFLGRRAAGLPNPDNIAASSGMTFCLTLVNPKTSSAGMLLAGIHKEERLESRGRNSHASAVT